VRPDRYQKLLKQEQSHEDEFLMDYEDDDDEERIIILNQHKQSLSRMTSQQTSGKRSDSTAEETV